MSDCNVRPGDPFPQVPHWHRDGSPISPHALLQEQVARDLHYPWRVIVSCALLNRTTGTAAHKAAGSLFTLWPDPMAWNVDFEWMPNAASLRALTAILQPLGLVNRRTELLCSMTVDYNAGISPYDCRGVGRYGRDALDTFCLGLVAGSPADHYLNAYVSWREQHGIDRIKWDERGYIEWLANRVPAA